MPRKNKLLTSLSHSRVLAEAAAVTIINGVHVSRHCFLSLSEWLP
jgi:hypothetical protein